MRLALFGHLASIEARARFSYRVDFWLNALVSFAVEMVVVWFLWDSIYRATDDELIGGYTFPQMVFYYVAVILVSRFTRGVNTEGMISGDIYEGGLNRYLVFPLAYRAVKYSQFVGALAPVLVQVLLFGFLAVPLLGLQEHVNFTPASIGMAAVAIAVGNLLFYLTIFPLQTVAFWADNVWSLMVMHRFVAQVLGGYMLPLTLFPGWARAILEILPFRYYFDFPVRVLIGEIGVAEWGTGLLVALAWCYVMWAVGTMIWRRGLKTYAGIGI